MNRQLRRALHAYLASQLTWNWNPLTWIGIAETDAKKIIRDIESLWKWVIKETVLIGDRVWHDLYGVYKWGDGQLNGVWHEIYAVIWPAIDTALSSIGGSISGALKHLEHLVAGWIDDAIKALERTGSWLWHEIDGAYHRALNDAKSYIEWFYRHVIRTVINTIWHGIHDLAHYVDKMITAIYHDLILKAWHDIDWTYHEVLKIIWWMDHSAIDAVRLVEHSWKWLEAFAAHPFNELESLPANIIKQLSTSWAEQAGGEVVSIWDPIVAELEKVFKGA